MGSNFRRNTGPPVWFVFLVGIAIVFGIYYLWLGARDFLATGMNVVEATQQARIETTATIVRRITITARAPTARPSATPLPECQDFIVIVDSAIIREGPTTESGIAGTVDFNEVVCVVQRAAENSEWYMIDTNTITRRLEPAYMREDLIAPVNPTMTPSNTFTPAPTITPLPTIEPSNTRLPTRTPSPNPDLTDTLTPTPTPTPTVPVINL